jgi:hypothetical protein
VKIFQIIALTWIVVLTTCIYSELRVIDLFSISYWWRRAWYWWKHRNDPPYVLRMEPIEPPCTCKQSRHDTDCQWWIWRQEEAKKQKKESA